MADAPDLIYNDRPGTIPANYRFPPGLDARLSSVSAVFDGTGAGADFLACLSVYSQDGKLIGRFPTGRTVPAGDVAEVTFAPFLAADSSVAAAAALDWAYMERDANLVTATGVGVTVDVWDAAGGNVGSTFAFDTVLGRIIIRRTGVYMAAGAVLWLSDGGNPQPPLPSMLQIDTNFDTGWPDAEYTQERTVNFGAIALRQTTTADLVIEVLLGGDDDYFELKVRQDSGMSRTLNRARLMVARLGDVG